MNVTSNIEGILPILHTPFDVDDDIDRDSLQREIDWAFEQGSNGVCSAMVSEILRLTSEERVEQNRLIVEMTAGRGNVVASVGAESTKKAVYFAKAAADTGCSARRDTSGFSAAQVSNLIRDFLAQLIHINMKLRCECLRVCCLVRLSAATESRELPGGIDDSHFIQVH